MLSKSSRRPSGENAGLTFSCSGVDEATAVAAIDQNNFLRLTTQAKTSLTATTAVGDSRPTLEQANLQLTRDPRPLPTMTLNPEVKSIFEFRFGDFTLEHYDPHPSIKAPIASATKVDQVKDFCVAADMDLSAGEIAKLNAAGEE